MAGSVYSYATLANIEDFTGIDYSTVDATALSDTRVEKKITIAERLINAYLGVTSAQTVTDGIKTCTVIIAAKLLDDNLKHLGYHGEAEHAVSDILNMSIKEMLSTFLSEAEDGFVASIPMTGASYHKPDITY